MRFSGAFFLVVILCRGADDPAQVLQRIRHNVLQQLSKSANYSCTETLVRSYFRTVSPVTSACQAGPAPERKQFARDQLRLDIAVSKDAELYSWHGENNFSSKRVSDIVETGPISSGGFVGYLQNIFLGNGIHFTYTGSSSVNGVRFDHFDFVVLKPESSYTILTGPEYQVVPFHGSFSAGTSDFELVTLKVVPDEIPFGSNVCSAETEIHYQLAPISGRSALIPESFQFTIDDDQHIYIVSRGEYSQCHEFRAESTLRFDAADSESSAGPVDIKPPERVPAGLTMHVSLTTPLNDRDSYAGDPVDAVLLTPVKLPGSSDTIPRGARLHGVITQLDARFEPSDHFYLKIVFERITSGDRSYVVRAVHKPTGKEMDKVSSLFGRILPKQIMKQLNTGTMIVLGKHLEIDQRFKGEWQTIAIAAPERSEEQAAKHN